MWEIVFWLYDTWTNDKMNSDYGLLGCDIGIYLQDDAML